MPRKSRRAKSTAATPRERLVEAAHQGGVTLVLGAGLSLELGAPDWRVLAIRVWQRAIAESGRPCPPEWENIEEFATHPQLYPVILELAEQLLGPHRFVEVVRASIYENTRSGHQALDSTLGKVAEVVRRDYMLGARRGILRVITFNADEFLREALRGWRRKWGDRMPFWRTMDHAMSELPSGRGQQPVPIYHVHGFLPREGDAFASLSAHRLVFTDSQYWSSGTSQASLANRTMNAALSDSHCIFIGLSMADPNLLRWLALRYTETVNDAYHQFLRLSDRRGAMPALTTASDQSASSDLDLDAVNARIRRRLAGHFWIRTPSSDQSGLLSEFLKTRGVEAVEISGWQDGSFHALMDECFPAYNEDAPPAAKHARTRRKPARPRKPRG